MKAELDRLTSLIVRKRDGACVQCGSRRNLTAGHLWSRKFVSVRFDLLNIHGQCWNHNKAHSYNPDPYFYWFLQTFGADEVVALFERRNIVKRFTDDDLRQMVDEYGAMLRTMKVAA
jgi:hypothetical protein